MEDLHEGVLAEFAERQERYGDPKSADQIFGGQLRSCALDSSQAERGFRVFGGCRPDAKRGPRRQYMIAYAARRHYDRIREALLRGERPSFARRPPVRWLAVARDLGIDLRAPTSPAAGNESCST